MEKSQAVKGDRVLRSGWAEILNRGSRAGLPGEVTFGQRTEEGQGTSQVAIPKESGPSRENSQCMDNRLSMINLNHLH